MRVAWKVLGAVGALLKLLVSIAGLILIGAPLGSMRSYRRGRRQVRRVARRCGAYDGHVLLRRTGAGPFNAGDCWESVTSLRPGGPAEVGAAVGVALERAGYPVNQFVTGGLSWAFPGTPARPGVSVTLVPAGAGLSTVEQLAILRRGRGPVLVWGYEGEPGGPGRAWSGDGGRVRCRLVLPPVVPVGSTGLLLTVKECRSPRPASGHHQDR